MISLPVLAAALAFSPQGRIARFPIGYLDYHGFVPAGQVPMNRETASGMVQLREGNASAAYQILSRSWSSDHADYAALHGLVLAAHEVGKLGELVGRFDRLGNGGRSPALGSDDAFALFYATNVAREYRREGDLRVELPGMGGVPSRYSASISSLKPAGKVDKRVYTVMMSSAHFADGEYALARRPLIDWLAKHPRDVEVHIMLGRMYQSGVLSHRSGNGPVHIAPPEEQMDLGMAIRHYRWALQIDPKCAEAYYELGNTLNEDRTRQLGYYRKAVRLGLQYAERQAAAEREIRRLSAIKGVGSL